MFVCFRGSMKVEFITSSFSASHNFFRQGCFTSSTAPHNFFSTGVLHFFEVVDGTFTKSFTHASVHYRCVPCPFTDAMRMAGNINFPSRGEHRPRCARAPMSHARARKRLMEWRFITRTYGWEKSLLGPFSQAATGGRPRGPPSQSRTPEIFTSFPGCGFFPLCSYWNTK